MPNSKRVYIVDNDVDVRTSLMSFFGAKGYIARPSSSGASFLADIATLRPGCVLLDLRMSEMDGIAVIKALGDRIAGFPVIVMTGHGDVQTAVDVMKLGASDYLAKPLVEDVLLASIETVFATLEAGVRTRDELTSARGRIDALTRRERDVLTGLSVGLSNKIIAHRLSLSVRTVEMHRASMMGHLAVRTLPAALRLAFVGGIGGGEIGSGATSPSSH